MYDPARQSLHSKVTNDKPNYTMNAITEPDIDKATADASERSGISETLIRAVLEQLGGQDAINSCGDIARHGIDGGFTGFVYYTDTVKFFEANRALIVGLVERMANDLGELPAEMVCGFGCLAGRELAEARKSRFQDTSRFFGGGQEIQVSKRNAILAEYMPSVSRCLYGGRLTDNDTQAANALAWFAGEEVARALHPDV